MYRQFCSVASMPIWSAATVPMRMAAPRRPRHTLPPPMTTASSTPVR